MKKMFALLLVLTFAVAACSKKEVSGPSKESSSAPAVVAAEGAPAPDFTLPDLDAKPVSLSSLKGNVVVVHFWATWCPPCREELPSIAKLPRELSGQPVRLVAVSIDEGGKSAVNDMLGRMKISLPVVLDGDSVVGKKYGITGVPETFIVDKRGIVVKKLVGGIDWTRPEPISFLKDLAAR